VWRTKAGSDLDSRTAIFSEVQRNLRMDIQYGQILSELITYLLCKTPRWEQTL
jgi:hypothetical protein